VENQRRERFREAHGKVVFRKGRERPPEPETAACAAWRVTAGTLPGYRAATFEEEEDTRLRCGEAGDVAGDSAGAPCLRRKYRGAVVVAVAAAAF